MNGPIAQMVALTCYGNAILANIQAPSFFPNNSTCQFCDSIVFIEFTKTVFGKTQEIIVANSPDDWFDGLSRNNAIGIRLFCLPSNNSKISGRTSAAFVGGGGTWVMEVLYENKDSEAWAARWEVEDQKSPDNRVWKVTYGLMAGVKDQFPDHRPLSVVMVDFCDSLRNIDAFAQREKLTGFTKCFEDALESLAHPEANVGYHKDLAVVGQLSQEAKSLLKASMSAWVFGGMGSWNDMSFDGEIQQEYDRVSDNFFGIINEAIAVAATSTMPDYF